MTFDIKNIDYRVQDRLVIDQMSLSVSAGASLLFLGPSGCGKTTLMNMMAGLLCPSSGDISFNGKNYGSLIGTRPG